MISHQHRIIFALTTAAAVSHHKMCTSALSPSPRWEDQKQLDLDLMNDAELSAICKRGGGFEIPMGEHPEMYAHADYVRLGGKCLTLLEDNHQPEEQREMILDNVFTDAWFTGFSEHQKRLFYIDMRIYEKIIKNPELEKGKDFVELLGGREVVLEHYHDREGFRKLVQLIHSGGYNWSRNLVGHVARLVRDEQDGFDRQHYHIEKALFACETEDDIDKSYCNIFDMKEVAHIIRKVRDHGGKSALVKLIVDNLYKGDVTISGIHESRHAFRLRLIDLLQDAPGISESASNKYRQNMKDMVDYNPGKNPNVEVFVRKMFERRGAVEYVVGVLLEYYPDNLIETLQERVRVDAHVTSKVKGIMKLFEDLQKEKDGKDLVDTAISHLFSRSATIDVSISSKIMSTFSSWSDPTAMEYLIMKLLKGYNSKSVSYEEIEALLNEVKEGNLDPVPISLYAGKDGGLHRGKNIPKKSKSALDPNDEYPGIDEVDTVNSHAWKVVIALSLVAIMLPVHRLELYRLWCTPTKKERRDAVRKREKMLLKGRECDGPNCSNVAGMRLQSGKKDKKGKKVHLYACERCMAHYYCCEKCQKEAWPRHKIWCWFMYFESKKKKWD